MLSPGEQIVTLILDVTASSPRVLRRINPSKRNLRRPDQSSPPFHTNALLKSIRQRQSARKKNVSKMRRISARNQMEESRRVFKTCVRRRIGRSMRNLRRPGRSSSPFHTNALLDSTQRRCTAWRDLSKTQRINAVIRKESRYVSTVCDKKIGRSMRNLRRPGRSSSLIHTNELPRMYQWTE